MKESEFEFKGFRVTYLEMSIADELKPAEETIKNELEVENTFFTQQPRHVLVELHIKINTDSGHFKFTLNIKGGFEAAESMPEDVFKNLARHNAPAILFPFARAIITSYTALANIPPITLPAYNFTQLEEIKEKKVEKSQDK